jgi:hypothetical protein
MRMLLSDSHAQRERDKGQDEEGDSFNETMPRWTFLSHDQVNSLIDYLKMIK